MVLIALSFDATLLRVITCFLGAISAVEEAFEENFVFFGRKILGVGTQFSVKKYRGDFHLK